MNDMVKKCAVELSWNEVGSIVSEKIEKILGLHIQCKANVEEGFFWSVTFIDDRLPLPKFCYLAQTTQPTLEEWEVELPADGSINVNGIGMVLAEKLIARHLKLTWEHHLITKESLWLVGVTKDSPR